MKKIVSVFIAITLSACSTPYLSLSEMDAHQIKEVSEADLCEAYNYTGWSGSDGKKDVEIATEVKRRKSECDPLKVACLSYGFKKNTPEFAQCVMLEKRAEEQRKATALQNVQNSIRQQQINSQPSYTDCHTFGNNMTCNTW